jgi:hypothetical protein
MFIPLVNSFNFFNSCFQNFKIRFSFWKLSVRFLNILKLKKSLKSSQIS